MKLVAGLELRGRGDVQMYRIEMPGPKVTKDIAADAKVQLTLPRAAFNELATKGHVKDWREAFIHGDAKATGIEQVLKMDGTEVSLEVSPGGGPCGEWADRDGVPSIELTGQHLVGQAHE